jgi:hypothetical protein
MMDEGYLELLQQERFALLHNSNKEESRRNQSIDESTNQSIPVDVIQTRRIPGPMRHQ